MFNYSRIRELLTPQQRSEFNIFIWLFLIGMILETFGIGLVVPILTILGEETINFQNIKLLNKLNLNEFSKVELIIISMIVLFCVYTIKTFFLTFIAYKQGRFLTNIKATLSEKFFKIYLNKSYSFHIQTNSAELIRNINDVNFVLVVVRSLLKLFTEAIVLVGVTVLLIYYEPYGAIASIFILGSAGLIFHRKIQSRTVRWGQDRQLHDGFRMQHLQQGFGAIKDIKVLGREDTFLDEFSNRNKLSAESEFKKEFLLELPRLWFEWLTIIGIILLVIIMMNQDKGISSFIPTLGLFAAAAFRLMPSIVRIMNCRYKISYGLPVIETLYKELKIPIQNKSELIKKDNQIIIKDLIELKKINYSFPKSDKKLFSSIDLNIKCGNSIGLIGKSGVGKTTLINIILGLLKPDSGDVIVGGKSIFHRIRSWQNQIGYVPQHIYLTDDTLRKNVAFGLPESKINDKLTSDALESAQLGKFVASLKKGVNTKVGEFGERLSGGQRQRIGIARALYNKPRILILDECTSSLDPKTEKAIINDVNFLKREKTIIMISHNLFTLSNCDVIYNLTEQGLENLEKKH